MRADLPVLDGNNGVSTKSSSVGTAAATGVGVGVGVGVGPVTSREVRVKILYSIFAAQIAHPSASNVVKKIQVVCVFYA